MTFRPPAAALASTAAGREPPVSPRMEERLEAAARRPAAALDVHTVEVGAYRVPKPAPRSTTQTLELCVTRGLTIRAVLTRQQARQLAFDLLGKSAVAILLCAFLALPLSGCQTSAPRVIDLRTRHSAETRDRGQADPHTFTITAPRKEGAAWRF